MPPSILWECPKCGAGILIRKAEKRDCPVCAELNSILWNQSWDMDDLQSVMQELATTIAADMDDLQSVMQELATTIAAICEMTNERNSVRT
eukprot:g73088.t1